MSNEEQNRRKVYIAGPIGGRENFNREAFARRAAELRAAGYEPVNPHDIPPFKHIGRCPAGGRAIENYEESHGQHNYGCYLAVDIVTLSECNGISLLDDWELSPGATAEYYFSVAVGIPEIKVPARYEEVTT